MLTGDVFQPRLFENLEENAKITKNNLEETAKSKNTNLEENCIP